MCLFFGLYPPSAKDAHQIMGFQMQEAIYLVSSDIGQRRGGI
jgi:hypothetical protein